MGPRREDASTRTACVHEPVGGDPEGADLRLEELLASQRLDGVAPELGDAHAEDNEARPPTIVDVAERAGVSKSVVSRVMRGERAVSAASREAVLAAAESLGYRPNAVARSLVQRRTFNVANPTKTKITVMIQNLTITFGSAHPFNSKW